VALLLKKTWSKERPFSTLDAPWEAKCAYSSLMEGVVPMLHPKPWLHCIPNLALSNGSIKVRECKSLLIVLFLFQLERTIKMRSGVILCPWMLAISYWGDLDSLIEESYMMAE